MGFSRQESRSGLPCPSPGDLPHPGIEPGSPALQTDSLHSEPPGSPKPLWGKENLDGLRWLCAPRQPPGASDCFHFLPQSCQKHPRGPSKQHRSVPPLDSHEGSLHGWILVHRSFQRSLTCRRFWKAEGRVSFFFFLDNVSEHF